jgi:hypothetical protein
VITTLVVQIWSADLVWILLTVRGGVGIGSSASFAATDF